MSKDLVYHGKRARVEISCAFKSATTGARRAHFELAGLHLQKMYDFASDAMDRTEADSVAAVLSYWKRRFSEASGHVPGVEMMERLRMPAPALSAEVLYVQPGFDPMFPDALLPKVASPDPVPEIA